MRKRLCRTAQIKSIRYHMKNRSYSGAHTWDGMGQKKFTSYWHHRWSVSLRGINSIRKMFNGFLCTNVCVCMCVFKLLSYSIICAKVETRSFYRRFALPVYFLVCFFFFFFFKFPIFFISLSIFLKWRMNWNENQIETVTTTTSINTNDDNEHTEKKILNFFACTF